MEHDLPHGKANTLDARENENIWCEEGALAPGAQKSMNQSRMGRARERYRYGP